MSYKQHSPGALVIFGEVFCRSGESPLQWDSAESICIRNTTGWIMGTAQDRLGIYPIMLCDGTRVLVSSSWLCGDSCAVVEVE